MRRRPRLAHIVVAVTCFTLPAFGIAACSGGDDGTHTRFTSPSGKRTVVVDESCFGFACGHSARLEGRFFDDELGRLDVGDAEACVFPHAKVQWSADEKSAAWEVATRKGVKRGVIVLPDA